MKISHSKILSVAVLSGLFLFGEVSYAKMASDSGCVWTVTTTTWSDGSQTVDTQLTCKAGGGSSGGDPFATNFGGGAWGMPSPSMYNGLVNQPAGGGGRQIASNSDDVVNDILNEAKTEPCVELTATEIAADAAGNDFPVLRDMCIDSGFGREMKNTSSLPRESSSALPAPLPKEGWDIATPADIADYKRAVGNIPKEDVGIRCLRAPQAMQNPAKDAKLPGECKK